MISTGATDSTVVTTGANYKGLTTELTDAKGNVTTKIIGVSGKTLQVKDPQGYKKSFGYDAFGSLAKVWDGNLNGTEIFSATYDYGVDAFQTSADDKDHGVWNYTYYATGEVKTQTDAKAQMTSYTYDALGRQLTRVEAEGTTTWTWGSSASAYNVGQLDSVTSPSGYSERNCYDNLGRLSKKRIRTVSGAPGACSATTGVDDATANFTYDYAYNGSTGLLETLQYPTSTSNYRFKAKYEYQNGILNKVLDANATSTVFWQANASDARGQFSDEQLGANARLYSVYDPVTGQPTQRQTVGNGTTHSNLGFAFDDNSNLWKRFDYGQSLTEEFTYDSRNVLDYSKLNGSTNLDVTVDEFGNLTYKSDVGTYTYDTTKKRRLMSTSNGWTFGYDANGNMTTYKGVSNAITWTSYNYPGSITANGKTSAFSYGPNREKWKQVGAYDGGTESTLYIGGLLEVIDGPVTGGGTTISYRHYVRAGNSTYVYTRYANGIPDQKRYLTDDQLGSNSLIIESTGALVARLSYDAYGKRRGSNWSGTPSSTDWTNISNTTREGYTGHTMLDNMGLIHMNGRVQDPTLGRFLSADPYVSEPGNTQNYNRYSYVYNNPLTYTDPSGFVRFSDCLDSNISGTYACMGGNYDEDQEGFDPFATGWMFAPEPLDFGRNSCGGSGIFCTELGEKPDYDPPPPYPGEIPRIENRTGLNIDAVMNQLMALPPQVLRDLAYAKISIILVSKSVTEAAPWLKGQKARGHEGGTFDSLGGVFINDASRNMRAVIFALKNPGASMATLLHEVGHAYDFAKGGLSSGLRKNSEFYDIWSASRSSFDPLMERYFLQGGNAGSQEAFAEGFAQFYGGHGDWAKRHPGIWSYFERLVP